MDLTTRINLRDHIHDAIEYSVSSLNQVHAHEPDYIAELVNKFPSKLSSLLNKFLPYAKFNVGGCFIHQKPLAKFVSPSFSSCKRSELGDLLIVYKEVKGNDTSYNAVLLQAKKTDDVFNTRIKKSDYHQLTLYTHWPRFEYRNAGVLTGKQRSITPKMLTPGAQYLLIDKNHNANHICLNKCTFWCAKADSVLSASNSLAMTVLQLIQFQTGRTFSARQIGMDHWSQMIWDLLTLTSDTFYNRKRIGHVRYPRYKGDSISFLSTLRNDDFSTINSNESQDEIGISVLCIEGIYND